ncbi:protein phosphatase 2C domain-containing protein [Kitasatospora sp. NPDC090091]|uniref:protein phosphatase 2C domain-containing protein n=1 Tax=Kitasatospora sp. NPDC090091 TaxID=3364081 RepID=UPI003825B0CE
MTVFLLVLLMLSVGANIWQAVRQSRSDEQHRLTDESAQNHIARLQNDLRLLDAERSHLITQLTAGRSGSAETEAARQSLSDRVGLLHSQLDAEASGRATAEDRIRALSAELAAESSGRARAEEDARALGAKLDELAAARAEPVEAPSPAVPRELPLGRDAVADSVVDGADLGPLVVRAASVRGESNRRGKEHRRDAVLLSRIDGFGSPVLLGSVASGAPGEPLSQTAATAACRALTQQLADYAPRLRGKLFGAGYDPEVSGMLGVTLAGVARSVQLVADGATALLGGRDAQRGRTAATSLFAVLSELDDRERDGVRQHIAFGVGDGAVLRLRDEGSGPRWTAVFEPERSLRTHRLPAAPTALSWSRFPTVPGDVVVVAGRPMAELLLRPDTGDWFAQRWSGRQPYLTSFLSDVNVEVRANTGGDRSVVTVWDYGQARLAEEASPHA